MTIQLPKNTPTGPIKLFPVWIVQIKPEKQTHSKNTAKNFLIVFIMLALFQDKLDPKGNIKPNKIIKGVKAALKNGGPTESFLSKNNSATKGHIVPTKITKADTANIKLFEINAVSLLASEKTLLDSIAPDLKLNSISAPPMKTPKIINIKNPLSGSLANA